MGMLKRKRSESEFSISSGSTLSSPPRPGSSGAFTFSFGVGTTSPIRYGVAPSHLPSRTLKRFRDNRLSEEEIHQNTLKMLYSAQQPHHNEPHHVSQQPPQHPTPTPTSTPQPHPVISPGQRSLHAFWNLPPVFSAPASRPDMLPPPIEKAALAVLVGNEHAACEDCGARIASPDDGGDAVMMNVDDDRSGTAGAARCVSCHKVVCGSCCVSNLGAEPRCLVCAGRCGRWTR